MLLDRSAATRQKSRPVLVLTAALLELIAHSHVKPQG